MTWKVIFWAPIPPRLVGIGYLARPGSPRPGFLLSPTDLLRLVIHSVTARSGAPAAGPSCNPRRSNLYTLR
jgi:hypothetical protein